MAKHKTRIPFYMEGARAVVWRDRHNAPAFVEVDTSKVLQALVEHLGIEVRANDKQLDRSGRVERFIEVRKKGS
jgi:hypothetical protein